MSENTVPAPDAEPARPLSLGRRNQPAAELLLHRIAPEVLPDDGMTPLDVAGFTSAI